MSNATTIHLIRHGEVHNPQAIYYGRLPGFHLSETGRLQAQATAKVLRANGLDVLYTSPLERAVETAEIIAQENGGIRWRLSDAIKEVHSPFDGQPIRLMADRNWDVYAGAPPPYEQPADVLRRVQEFVRQVRREHRGERVALITHGDVIMFMTLWANGLPLTAEAKQAFYFPDYLGYASISTFRYQTESAQGIPDFSYMATPFDDIPPAEEFRIPRQM